MIVYGLNPVLEALRAGRVRKLRVGPRSDRRVEDAIALARKAGVTIERTDAAALDRAARGGVHQGLAAEVEAPLLVVLDSVEDPHNVGAILRSLEASGGHGVVRQARHAASLDGIVAKASAGAVARVRIATVVNIARALDELKEAGVWTVGLAADAPESYDEIDLTLASAIVLGAEGSGLRRLVRERCDRLAGIPMRGHAESLNVSVAAGVMLFEAARQRRRKNGV